MKNGINYWLQVLLIIGLVPIFTVWDSLVGVWALSMGLMWMKNITNKALSRIIFGIYLSGWLSWWLALPWWQTAGLILVFMFGQSLIKPGVRHYQLISLSYLLGSIVITSLVLGDWSQPIGVWSILGYLTVSLVMITGWLWLRKSPVTNSGTNWYVQ